MSPSSYIEKNDLDKAAAFIETLGYKVFIHPQSLSKHNQSAGNNTEKVTAFHELIKNPEIKAIIFSSGGNRALHWADNIDYSLVKTNPKIIMGFSDITSILNLINQNTGIRTFHGPTMRWFAKHENNVKDIQQCFELLSNIPNNIETQMLGGNASIFQYLINDLSFEGKTLFLEDWNIETSHLDLIFCHLKRSGVFDKISKLILGQFDNLQDSGRPYGFTLEDIIAEHVPSKLPLITGAPFGHGDRLITIPIG